MTVSQDLAGQTQFSTGFPLNASDFNSRVTETNVSLQNGTKDIFIRHSTENIDAGEDLIAGEFVRVSSNTLLKTDNASSAGITNFIGCVLEDTLTGASCPVAVNKIEGLTGLTAGVPYYLGGSGSLVSVLPTTAHIKAIGYAVSTTSIQFSENSQSTNWASTVAISDKLGVGIAPVYKAHIYKGLSGATAIAGANDFVVESNANVGTSILLTNTSTGNISWSAPSYQDMASIASGYNSSSPYISFSVAGAERIRIKNNGNIGIGIDDPQAKVHLSKDFLGLNEMLRFSVSDGTYEPRFSIYYDTSETYQTVQFDSSYSTGVGFADFEFLNAGVYVAKGKISFGQSGSEYGSIGCNLKYTSTNSSYTYNGTDYANKIDFLSGTISMYTAPVGTTGNPITFTKQLEITNAGALKVHNLGTSASSLDVNYNITSKEIYYVTSSKRFKKNIVDIGKKIETEKVFDLRPVYNLRKKTNEVEIGIIAEEAQEVLPILVPLDEEGVPITVSYTKLPVIMLAELKKMKVIQDGLLIDIKNLEKSVTTLKMKSGNP